MPDLDAVGIERYKLTDKYKEALKWMNARHARDKAALKRMGIGANIRTNSKRKKRRVAPSPRSSGESGLERREDGENPIQTS